jgi:hypothetical protein
VAVLEKGKMMSEMNEATDNKLWCVNVHGPDDLYAMPNRAAALECANMMNVYFATRELCEFDPVICAVAIEWPYSAESHGDALRDASPSPALPANFGLPPLMPTQAAVSK